MTNFRQSDARPTLGCTLTDTGTHFCVYSEHATSIDVCLFDQDNTETDRIALTRDDRGYWSVSVSGLAPGQLYGLRAAGPWSPDEGHRFNPAKLLLDPYAKEISGTVQHGDALSANNDLDSSAFMPKGAVPSPTDFDWQGDVPLQTPWADTVIYEAHAKGLTMQHPDVPDDVRGTFDGLAHPSIISHLKNIGITAIELLPVHAFIDEPFLLKRNLTNYWGYNTLNFFTPDPRYCGPAGNSAFKNLVRTYHAHGIEVILDVVYNHTAESDALGPTLSFRGLDNATYYHLPTDDLSGYINDTGCGNTVDISHPVVTELVLDSLRYWVDAYHVDGFRFDLAPVLGRSADGYSPAAPFFDRLLADPVLAGTKLIAEPWDIGPGGYQLGQFPAGFAEWNDRFRDDVRRFWRGDVEALSSVAGGIMGSADLFDTEGRSPHASVNFVTAHDGFSLRDLVSYVGKHNIANGENNRDGHSENLSSNGGVEGDTFDADILSERDQRRRNLLATILLSQGTPMILAGDEVGNSQQGNNNAYCQDNEIGWVDWSGIDDPFLDFVRALTQLRRSLPAIGQDDFLHGEDVWDGGPPNVEWLSFDDDTLSWDDDDFDKVAILKRDTSGHPVIIAVNSSENAGYVSPPESAANKTWRRVFDTSAADGCDHLAFDVGDPLICAANSISVFVGEDRA